MSGALRTIDSNHDGNVKWGPSADELVRFIGDTIRMLYKIVFITLVTLKLCEMLSCYLLNRYFRRLQKAEELAASIGRDLPAADNEDIGPNGDNEDIGLNADNEDMGPNGDNEDIGLNADNEDMGPNGDNEDMGLNGDNEDMGPNGDNEDMGPNGDNEDMGPNGDNEDIGPNGDNEDIGPNGDNEDMGPNGDNEDIGPNADNEGVVYFPPIDVADAYQFEELFGNDPVFMDEEEFVPDLMDLLGVDDLFGQNIAINEMKNEEYADFRGI